MAKQDDWARITLRLPPKLHAQLQSAAENGSLNAEIIDRLELSFQREDAIWHPPARFRLDAEGRPLDWGEISRHVASIVEAFPDPVVNVTVEVLTPAIIAALKARQDEWETEFPGWTKVEGG